MITPEDLMQLAIEKCRAGIMSGESPFGCAIERGENVVSVEHNTVLSTTDITAHAEINAIRRACRKVNDIFLESAIVATTCEPCPMCMAALHWARVDVVYYGATIADADTAGFNELQLPAADVLNHGGSSIKLVAGVLPEECQELFQVWKSSPAARSY